MTFTLRFGNEAGSTYQAIVAQLYERWSEKTVLQFEGKVKKYLGIINQSPYLYPIADDTLQLRKCIIHKNCSILYKVYDKEILIVCFWDNRQDPLFQ